MKALLIYLALVGYVLCDLYMQNPRGSNDRLNEANTNRNNANRLFDSQNNAKGGYCIGPKMKYYVGSRVTVEWTNQHGCGTTHSNLHCNVVIQYMCSNSHDNVRDGTTTNRIPNDPVQAEEMTTNPDEAEGITGFDPTDVHRDGEDVYVFGKHESYDYYQLCETRERNKRLFIADRNVGGAARNTRQNNNGNRHGFECPEERDYYPYWHPNPWKDIAILTDDMERCDFYKANSGNVRGYGLCSEPQFNTKSSCNQNGGKWDSNVGDRDRAAPECLPAPWSRDNHLGNGVGGWANMYNWTIPDDPARYCVLRIRYNISTSDYDGWNTDAGHNAEKSPVKQDPYVKYPNLNRNLSLALDTSQFGRTFQDRTHTFQIRERPGDVINTARIFNLEVKGKRGNIVQTYPAHEYDFQPTHLEVRDGDYIHFQWTGCDTNPNGNDGEGTRGTDRSNMVQMSGMKNNYPNDWDDEDQFFTDEDDRSFMAHLGQYGSDGVPNPDGGCLTYAELAAKNNDNQDDIDRDVQNCMKLNNAPRYLNFGLHRVQKGEGRWHFMSSRNNNFTNRSQKGSIAVVPFLPVWAVALVVLGGMLFLSATGVATLAVVARALPGTKLGQIWLKIT